MAKKTTDLVKERLVEEILTADARDVESYLQQQTTISQKIVLSLSSDLDSESPDRYQKALEAFELLESMAEKSFSSIVERRLALYEKIKPLLE